jgi:hypothetical protein
MSCGVATRRNQAQLLPHPATGGYWARVGTLQAAAQGCFLLLLLWSQMAT